jgi:hypothetical protein
MIYGISIIFFLSCDFEASLDQLDRRILENFSFLSWRNAKVARRAMWKQQRGKQKVGQGCIDFLFTCKSY